MASYIPPYLVDGGNHLALPPQAQNDSEESFEETAYTSKADDWNLMPDVKAYQQQNEADHLQGRKLGVTWTNLTVKGISADASLNENVLSQFNVPQMLKESRHKQPLKTILEDSHGCVKPGEMLLVVGRPGAGCTTLLKMLSNRRSGFAEVNGKVSFGSLSGKDAERYRGQIVINTEEELFFPTLEVGHTMDFATKLKVPNKLPTNIKTPGEFQKDYRNFLLKALGIEHTEHTKVGNEYVRGVSGGERKRISIAETIASRASVFCWDNSTRGLDASTALQYTKAIRAMTDIVGLSTIATFYQASNAIYQLFDKVIVLDEGKQIYYGPMDEARPFMEELGFFCDPSANVADYLTGLTVPLERRIREGFDDRFPHTANEIRDLYEKSSIRAAMEQEYGYPDSVEARKNTEEFKLAITSDKNNFLPRSSPLTVGFGAQVKACILRQSQIIWGDQATFFIKQGATLIQALVVGSLFYKASNDTEGLFYKSGALFFALLYQSLMALSEVTDSFTGRPILAKHKSFAFYDPAAFCIAQLVLDIPILLFQITQFSVVIYFIVGLKATAAAFFTFWILIFAVAMCVTAMFRLIGAASTTFDAASKISGFLVSAIIIYIGYFIPKTEMHPWFSWIYWINPLAWGFQSILANEFRDDTIQCIGNNLIPSGPSYTDSAFQSCAGVQGAVQGSTLVTGEQYLAALSYSASHIWRNFGVIWALWALFSALTIVFTRNWKPQVGKGSSLLIPREYTRRAPRAHDDDQEKQSPEKSGFQTSSPNSSTDNIEEQLIKNTSVFTWQNLTYTVKTQSGDRVLLDNVQGWVKPGMLGALMGSSGAGKTTLLDVLAQRKTDGRIQGSVLVDGRDLSVSFQRSAGYCEQLDVHEPLATVREALEFSALLRQSRSISREEKIKYVDTIIDLLEMQDIEHTLIGRPGAGLSVEQRKRLTIGVELVAKPRILIFLDEPTSGLDGQAAFNTLRFLKKLAGAGQAVLVTIHQPSAQLFKEFDTLLLLAKGGKTVYFGDIGDDAQTLSSYFARHGAPCPPDTNPAEHMIDVVSGSASQGRDWSQIWLESPECKNVESELDRIVTEAAAKEPGTKDDGTEFAMPLWQQTILVTSRMSTSLYRNTEYVNNKIALHIGAALFNGFTFWMIGNTVADLQLRLFTIFNFIFVAPGVINQLQPLFIDRRDIYEVREKKSKMYSWKAFVTGLIFSEIPYLCICAVFYFACWYFTVGFPSTPSKAGATFFVMIFYEFIYTGIGQFVAAYAPNAVFASLVNPVIITILVSFCGVLVPYQGIQEFWRYWIYYINPFNYLMGSILTFTVFDVEVTCADHEFALFNTPNNQSCRSYLAPYLSSYGAGANLVNPDATSGCRVCQYSRGSDYLATLNLPKYLDGWRDAAIVVIFAISSYVMVYFFMKLRTKATKKAEGN